MLITNKDKEVSNLKIQKDIIKQFIKEIQMKKFTIENDDETKKYIKKMIMNILIKTVLYLNILVILLF